MKPRPIYGDSDRVEHETDTVLAKYLFRAQVAPRVMARWAAYNDTKLASGEWKPEDFAVFMQKVAPVVVLLQSLAFGACAQAVQAFEDPLATEEAKSAYLEMMVAEGALPNLK